jgi:hypothetical protein
MSNPEKFTALEVEWDYTMHHAVGSPNPVRMRTNPKKVKARCESCGTTFTATAGQRPGQGSFINTISGPGYECTCRNAGTIDIAKFAD